MLKSLLPNGLKPKVRNSPDLRGKLDTEHLVFQKQTWKPSFNTLPTSANTTERKPFRRNTGHFLCSISCRSMNDMCGISFFNQCSSAPKWRHTVTQTTPWDPSTGTNRGPKVRPQCLPIRPGLQPSGLSGGQSQGVALGYLGPPRWGFGRVDRVPRWVRRVTGLPIYAWGGMVGGGYP